MNLTVNETLSPSTKPTLNNERILKAAVFNVVEALTYRTQKATFTK